MTQPLPKTVALNDISSTLKENVCLVTFYKNKLKSNETLCLNQQLNI